MDSQASIQESQQSPNARSSMARFDLANRSGEKIFIIEFDERYCCKSTVLWSRRTASQINASKVQTQRLQWRVNPLPTERGAWPHRGYWPVSQFDRVPPASAWCRILCSCGLFILFILRSNAFIEPRYQKFDLGSTTDSQLDQPRARPSGN